MSIGATVDGDVMMNDGSAGPPPTSSAACLPDLVRGARRVRLALRFVSCVFFCAALFSPPASCPLKLMQPCFPSRTLILSGCLRQAQPVLRLWRGRQHHRWHTREGETVALGLFVVPRFLPPRLRVWLPNNL